MSAFFSFPQNFVNIVIVFYQNFFFINCTWKYSNLLAEEQQTLRRWFATPHLTLPMFITFVNSKSFFKTSHTQHIAYPTICRVSNNISTVTLQNSFNFIFSLHYKSGETSKKFLQMSHFLLHSFIEHLFCLVVQGNNDGDKISLRLLFLL